MYSHLLHTLATHAHVLTVTAKNPTPDPLLHPWEWPSPWGESSCPRPPLWSHSKDSRAQGVPLCARRPFSLSPPPPHSLSPIWFMVERRPAAAWGAAHSQIHPLNPKTRGWIHAHESLEKQKNIITCQRDVNNWSSFFKMFWDNNSATVSINNLVWLLDLASGQTSKASRSPNFSFWADKSVSRVPDPNKTR